MPHGSCPRPILTGAAGLLYFSTPAKADGDFARLHDNGDLPAAFGDCQHAIETGRVFKHVDVIEWNLSTGEILTGSRRVGSKVLAEDLYFFCFRH